jgi:hypothetical protein
MKPAAVAILQQRATAAGLTNVSAHLGMVEQYTGPLDVALALHACGNATDHVLRLAQARRAAFIVSPCCVGAWGPVWWVGKEASGDKWNLRVPLSR